MTIPPVGDQLSRRRERLEVGVLRGRVGDLLLESRRGQELLRRQRLPLALSREVERWPPSVLPSKHRRASAGRRFGSIDLTAVESETHSLGTPRRQVGGEVLCDRDGWQDSPLPFHPPCR